MLVVARNVRTLRKYWPCQQNQGSGLQLGHDFSNKNALKNHSKNRSIFGWILEGFWRLNKRFLVAKILSKIDVFLARFLEGYLNIDGAATGAPGVPRLCRGWYTFGGRRPWGAPLYQRLQYYNTPKAPKHL